MKPVGLTDVWYAAKHLSPGVDPGLSIQPKVRFELPLLPSSAEHRHSYAFHPVNIQSVALKEGGSRPAY